MKTTLVNSPTELAEALAKLFPGYAFSRDEYDALDFSYHAVLKDFIHFFRSNHSKFKERQLKDFAALINAAVEAGGTLENAFGTCFLEHLGQLGVRKPLSSFLSSVAKERLHA